MTNANNSTDPHTKAAPPQDHSPVLGTLLHVMSMSIIVFTRYRFGYAFLKPQSIFILLSLLLAIFAGFAWTSRGDNQLWKDSFALLAFSATWIVGYFSHCLVSIALQWRKEVPLDNAAGIHFIGGWKLEVMLGGVIGTLLYSQLTGYQFLGIWMMAATIALAIKESLKAWYRNRIETVRVTSEKKSESLAGNTDENSAPQLRQVKKRGNTRMREPVEKQASQPTAQEKIKFASVLGLEPPYTAAKAKRAYRNLLKTKQQQSAPDSTDRVDLAPLREACEFFQRHYL